MKAFLLNLLKQAALAAAVAAITKVVSGLGSTPAATPGTDAALKQS